MDDSHTCPFFVLLPNKLDHTHDPRARNGLPPSVRRHNRPPQSDFERSLRQSSTRILQSSTTSTLAPTNSWISNLFYDSHDSAAPTVPDPYILKVAEAAPY
ncbi:hypothetical protein BC938DRAFT_480475 [Jimgerdemannia flammicorona]|uniref:Uncharacterized protein n=1 Tax=Jimgerdemannia flammicorona TaxID=994334 RepID=A0A433QIM5_9FUNG|nr:hypothetical protein BC938DRAFT_480475 [Jimgerdemannia flammicorona]